MIYDNYELTFKELLEKNESFTTHHYNIQRLCIELYKVYQGILYVDKCCSLALLSKTLL